LFHDDGKMDQNFNFVKGCEAGPHFENYSEIRYMEPISCINEHEKIKSDSASLWTTDSSRPAIFIIFC
jgi:hypothetical protein